MTKIKKILIFLSAVLLVIAGNKKNSDFTAKNKEKNNKEVLEQHTAELKKIIDESETNKQKVAPGLYAEYGQILFETGKKEDAKRYFFLEKTTYPESATFIDQVVKKLYGEG